MPPARRSPPAARHRRWRAATSARCAASSAAKRNACGVWARNRPSRGTVAVITPSATRFSVSATGTAGIAPARCSSAASRAGMVPGGISGRAASCTSTTSGAECRQRLQSGAHAVLAGRATRHRRQVRQAARAPPRSRPRRRPAAADRRGRPAPRRRGGSPAFRRASETASASRRRIGCRTRRRPGSLLCAWPQRCRPADWRQQRSRTMGRAVLNCHSERKRQFRIAHRHACR